MSPKGVIAIVAVLFVAFIGLGTLFGSFYTIDEGQRGVILRNGAYAGIANQGLNFKLPWVDSVVEVSVRSDTAIYDKVQVYSRDQQPVNTVISVTYTVPLDQVESVYRNYGSRENLISRILSRQINEQAEIVFGKYSAPDIPKNRAQLSLEISNALKKIVQGTPILITNAQLENIDFSDEYEASIQQRMLAEVEVQKVRQNADREKITAEITVIKAQAEAQSVLAGKKAIADGSLLQAKATAESTRIQGEAEASAIDAKGKALRDNPAIVALTQAEKWSGTLPTYVTSGAPIPFLNMEPLK